MNTQKETNIFEDYENIYDIAVKIKTEREKGCSPQVCFDPYEQAWGCARKEYFELKTKNDRCSLASSKLKRCYEGLRKSLSDGEHLSWQWVKDAVELQAECEILVNAKHTLEVNRLKKQLDIAKGALCKYADVKLWGMLSRTRFELSYYDGFLTAQRAIKQIDDIEKSGDR